MYSQILIHPSDRPFQRILFQKDSHGLVKDYQLNTVTFGVNCAPFLAIRTLLQLANECEANNPKVASILRKETYVDDILSGGFSIEETLKVQMQLISILNSAGFPLKKLTANDKELLTNIPPEDLYDMDILRFHETSSTKTLGIKLNAVTDTFTYSFSPLSQYSINTKRKILSAVVQLFDPAGWIAPVVIRGKIFDATSLVGRSKMGRGGYSRFPTRMEKIGIRSSIRRKHIYTTLVAIHAERFCANSRICRCFSGSLLCVCFIRCESSNFVVFSNFLISKSRVAP